jgi:predicted nucleic acid-binding protein
LIDSDWIIDSLTGVAPAIATLAEIPEGASHRPDPVPRLTAMHRLLAGYMVLDVTETIGERFAQERAALRRQGKMIEDLDLLIAATALTRGLALVTRNIHHFERNQA